MAFTFQQYGQPGASSNRQTRVSTDRFGNPFQLKFAGQVVVRKDTANHAKGEILENNCVTWLELGNKLYKIEISDAKKTKEIKGVTVSGVWVKCTLQTKRNNTAQTM